MDSRKLSTGELFRLITGYGPYDYQLRAWERIGKVMRSGGKVVIEVPTAGGKTEATLMPFLAETHNGTWAVSRLIYVLPTRSLVEKQAERIRKLLTEVLKLKGKSEKEARELAKSLVTVEYGLEPTHAFLGWIIVTTWDTFLYGLAAHRTVGKRFTFPVGAIAQSLVVFDEVQMYQDEGLYMPRLLSLVVETLEKANVPVVVMSATIPTALREMIAGKSEIVTVEETDVRKPERGKVKVRIVEGTIEDVLDDIKRTLKEGNRVLVVRNTVDRAVSTYLTLKPLARELGVKPLLIHGRFAVVDRKEKEKDLDNAQLIIATQVVEAGLDLPNVGLVVTDIAPLDALIQRIGRCARRKDEEGEAIVLVGKGSVDGFPEVRGFSEVISAIEGRIGEKIETEPFVEFENHKDYKRVVKLTLDVPGKKQNTWYIGTPRTVNEVSKKKKPPKDLFIVPYETAPYDPLVLLLSYDELGSLEQYLYDVEKAREALDRVYRFHYVNNIVPREFYSAYVYFRELRLFSAPPEYELRSRPELYAMLYVLDEKAEKELDFNSRKDVNLDPSRIIRIGYSTLKAQWEDIKNCIKGKLVRKWDSEEEKYRWVPERVSEKNPKALTIYAVSSKCYSRELGFWRGMSEEQDKGMKQASKENDTRNVSSGSGKRNDSRKTAQATLLNFRGGERMNLFASPGQTLKSHVDAMLKAWECVKEKYIPSIIRAMKAWDVELSEEDADRLMKSLIILHDSGKGARLYQDYLLGRTKLSGFRHELVSSYYALKILPELFNEKTAFVGSLVVMLHHEPILMGQIAGLDRDSLSAEVVLDKLRNFDGVIPELNEFLKGSFRKHLGVEITVPEAFPEELIRAVVELSVKARHLPDAGKLRLIVGALLIPLILCDYKGAEEREGGTPKFAEVLEAEWLGVV